MKTKIKTIPILILFACGAGIVHGQAAPEMETATDKFSAELRDLKNSADKLSMANEVLGTKNNDLKKRLGQLQLRLQQLADENNGLTRAVLKLQDGHPSRAKKIAQLEKNIFEIDNTMDRLTEEIKTDKDALDRSGNEDSRLTKQIAGLGPSQPMAPDEPSPQGADYTKEKLHLLKMIEESKAKQEELYRQMADIQKRMPATAVTVETSGDKQILLTQINQVQEEIDRLSKMSDQPAQEVWDQDQMRQLEAQVRQLQKNHDELEGLVARMQQKAQKAGFATGAGINKDRMNEQNRLRTSLDEVRQENKKLKQDLNDLRQHMVELDKRKTRLEAMVRN